MIHVSASSLSFTWQTLTYNHTPNIHKHCKFKNAHCQNKTQTCNGIKHSIIHRQYQEINISTNVHTELSLVLILSWINNSVQSVYMFVHTN